jgi:hypothetical protein
LAILTNCSIPAFHVADSVTNSLKTGKDDIDNFNFVGAIATSGLKRDTTRCCRMTKENGVRVL